MDLRDRDQVKQVFHEYFMKRTHYKQILYKKEKYKEISEFKPIEFDSVNIVYHTIIHYLTPDNLTKHRAYLICIYLDQKESDQAQEDKRHYEEIKSLNLYPIKHVYFEQNFKKIGYQFMVIEEDSKESVFKKIRLPVNLRNDRWVNQKLHYYLSKRKWFRRRGQKLLNRKEKFIAVENTQTLGYGLNNAVYEFQVKFKSQKNTTQFRAYILRVYPQNKNKVKAYNEAKRLKQINIDEVHNPDLFLFEKNLKHIGYRFLILEKIPGNPIVDIISTLTEAEAKKFLSDLAKSLGMLHSIRSKSYDSYYIEEKITKNHSFSSYIMMEIKRTLQNFKNLTLDEELDIDTEYLYKWCKGHKPLLKIEEFSLIHGDIRPSNILINNGNISGIIDWEMSCFSDPAHDIGWSLFFFKLYEHLKNQRGFFFSEYWKSGNEFDIEARVYFYEVLAAVKLYIYTRHTEQSDPEKYQHNRDFFERVKKLVPDYIQHITHRD